MLNVHIGTDLFDLCTYIDTACVVVVVAVCYLSISIFSCVAFAKISKTFASSITDLMDMPREGNLFSIIRTFERVVVVPKQNIEKGCHCEFFKISVS